MSSIVTLRPNSDSYVHQGDASQNFGQVPKLILSNLASNQRHVFLSFPIVPARSGIVLSATLRLVVRGDEWSASTTLSVLRVTESWREKKINWTNRPSATGTAATEIVSSAAQGDVISIDVTDIVQAMANGATFFGFRITNTGNAVRAMFSSEGQDPGRHPELEIEWADKHSPPQNLTPGGGLAVSVAQPVLSWDALTQASYQYEIYSDEELTTLLYDSTQTTSVEQSATSGYSLANGATVFWRVRTWDDANVDTDWSDPEEFTRVNKDTLTLTNPADTDPDPSEVDETTPPFQHTFSGTQVAASWRLQKRLFVTPWPNTNPWKTIYFLEKSDTTDTVWTPPAKLIKNETTLYRIVLRVWDDVDRVDMPNDRAFYEVVREFYYDRAGGVTAPTGLTATPVGPYIHFEWTSSTPDEFAMLADGESIEEPIDIAEALVSAGVWELDYYGHRPGHEVEYEIEAIRLDAGKRKHSDGNPTETVTLPYTQPHILVPSEGWAIPITGGGLTDTNIGADFEILRLPGRQDPVKVTSRIGGYEGTLEGYLIDGAETAEALRDKLEAIAGFSEGIEVRVSYADHNFPIMVDIMTFTPAEKQRWHVVIPFLQVGDFTFDVL